MVRDMKKRKPFEQVTFRASPGLLRALDELTANVLVEHGNPTRSDAIRAAIMEAFEARRQRVKGAA